MKLYDVNTFMFYAEEYCHQKAWEGIYYLALEPIVIRTKQRGLET